MSKYICPHCEKEVKADEAYITNSDGDRVHIYCSLNEDGTIVCRRCGHRTKP